MRKVTAALIIFGAWILICWVESFAQDFTWENISREHSDIKTALIEPDNPRIIYIGTKHSGIFKSEDAGDTWRNILSGAGPGRSVNFLLFDPQQKNSLYAAGGNGLFFTANQGKNWRRIFRGKNYLENECISAAVLPYGIYLGTKAGLFVSKDNARTWQRCQGKVGSSHILAIACNLKEPDYIYVACADGVFRSADRAESWKRVFAANAAENAANEEEKDEGLSEEERPFALRHISCGMDKPNELYLATSRGVYKSIDRGENWEVFSVYGLLSRDVRFLLASAQSYLYAAAKSGVFEYKNERWQELSLNLAVEEVNFLSLDRQDNLYAACDRGLFKRRAESIIGYKPDNLIALYYKDEPQIEAVQDAAIKYAEVEPEKIKQWRVQAAKKAWLPQLSVGIDRNTSDLWHWEGGSTTKTDDDILRRGRASVEWDVTLSWDLGELIWNDDQANIDVRSRLMVQLRDDVLDEVTKLYFEKIRVKMELDNLSIEDRKKRFEKELKLQELTAQLDGLTGGYFSSQIK